MKIREIMTTNPTYITPDSTLEEAARMMENMDVGTLPVGDGIKLKGMITDRDIVIRSTARGDDPTSVRVTSVMTPEVQYIFEDQSVEEAIDMMKINRIRRLIVLNRDKNMTGIVALADLANKVEESPTKAEALESVSAG